jgi:hypothetical protein
MAEGDRTRPGRRKHGHPSGSCLLGSRQPAGAGGPVTDWVELFHEAAVDRIIPLLWNRYNASSINLTSNKLANLAQMLRFWIFTPLEFCSNWNFPLGREPAGTQDQLLRLIGRMPPGGSPNSALTQFRKAPYGRPSANIIMVAPSTPSNSPRPDAPLIAMIAA